MEDRLKEIEGTLARTAQRKDTILYRYEKEKQMSERLSELNIKKLPSNPEDTDSTDVVKYVLFTLKRDFGDKRSKLRDPAQISVDKDGEEVVRLRNNELNTLLIRIKKWENRLKYLQGGVVEPVARGVKQFFGCAKDLPEATKATKRERDKQGKEQSTSSEVSDTSEEDLEQQNLQYKIAPYIESVSRLKEVETESEIRKSESEFEQSKTHKDSDARKKSGFRLSYVKQGEIDVPDETFFKTRLIELRKKALKEKMEMAKLEVKK